MKKLFRWVKQHKLVSFMLLCCGIMVLFALVAPWIFVTHSSPIAFNSETGAIGDTFGIMNPFIAIAAVLVTFAAFWVQYQANQAMLSENRKQQIITRFYEMLKIHRDNIKELEWVQTIYSPKKNDLLMPIEELTTRKGRAKFNYYLTEFNIIYSIIDILIPKQKKKEKISIAYKIFYYGGENIFFNYDLRAKIIQQFAEDNLEYFTSNIKKILPTNSDSTKLAYVINTLFQNRKYFISQIPFYGHFEELHNYYRHLFLMVKTIANEDEKNIPYPEKRDLLNILRAQLSYREQIMLFYNWFSGNGELWEEEKNEGNHFFHKVSDDSQYCPAFNVSIQR